MYHVTIGGPGAHRWGTGGGRATRPSSRRPPQHLGGNRSQSAISEKVGPQETQL